MGSRDAFPISAQLLDMREKIRIGLATIEQRDLVSPIQGRMDKVSTQELRSAQDQKLHPRSVAGYRLVASDRRNRHAGWAGSGGTMGMAVITPMLPAPRRWREWIL